MATNMVTVNVYEINGIPCGSFSKGVPAQGTEIDPYHGLNYSVLYGVIRTIGDPNRYSIVETPAAFKALVNA